MKKVKLPDFKYEKLAFKKGYRVIAGMDEVGRGSFAGPVVAGCVVFNLGEHSLEKPGMPRINDSKKLSPKKRELASYWIKRNAFCYGIGKSSVAEIGKFGIKKATEMAFRRAIKNCGKKIDFLLMDAFYVPYIKGLRRKNQMPIIKGDTKSVSVAAASIIAKVYRDKLMTRLSQDPKYKMYGWNKNKGYGTLIHRNAIKEYGVTKLHRKDFVD